MELQRIKMTKRINLPTHFVPQSNKKKKTQPHPPCPELTCPHGIRHKIINLPICDSCMSERRSENTLDPNDFQIIDFDPFSDLDCLLRDE